MRVRELKRKVGNAKVSVWAQGFTSSYSGADKFAVGEVGTLKSVKRRGDTLTYTIDYDGREHLATLQWDAPPTVEAVQRVLEANIGKPLTEIGGLEVGPVM